MLSPRSLPGGGGFSLTSFILMPWVQFTSDDIRDGLAVREVEIYESTAGEDSEGNVPVDASQRIDRIRDRTVSMFRGAIASNPQVTALGPDGTLPDFCIAWAAAIARVAMLGLNPVEEGRTDPRRDEYTDAIKGRDSLKTMRGEVFATVTPEPIPTGSFGGSPLLDF